MNQYLRAMALPCGLLTASCALEAHDADNVSQELSSSGGELAATLTIKSRWQTGYCASVQLTNESSSTIRSWQVSIAMSGATLNKGWNADFSTHSDSLLAKNLSYNANIEVGSSTDFGFCAKASAGQTPALTDVVQTGGTPVAEPGDSTGSGGSTDSGGSTASGGSTDSGGFTGSGGSTDSGGSTGSGGSNSGGSTGSGSSTDSGGSTGSGGSTENAWDTRGPGLTWSFFFPEVVSTSSLKNGNDIFVPQLTGSDVRFQLQVKAESRFTLFSDASRDGFVSARYTVQPGDTWESGASGIRSEIADLEGSRREGEGTETWWAWSTRFPNNFVLEGYWNIFSQWHGGSGHKPPLVFDLVRQNSKDVMRVLTRGGEAPNYRDSTKWTLDDSLDRGVWYDFVVHLISSSDPKKGHLTVWVNGEKKADAATNVLYRNSDGGSGTNYFKQGLYRGNLEQMKTTVSVEHAATRRGTACTSVAPSTFCTAVGEL